MELEGARSIAADAQLDAHNSPSVDTSTGAETRWPPHSGRRGLGLHAPRGAPLCIPVSVAIKYATDSVYDRFEKIRRQQSAAMRATLSGASTAADLEAIRVQTRQLMIRAARTSRILIARLMAIVQWCRADGRQSLATKAMASIRAGAASEEGLAHVSGSTHQLGAYAQQLALPTPDTQAALTVASATSPGGPAGIGNDGPESGSSTGIADPLLLPWRALHAAASASAGPDAMVRALEILHPGAGDRLGSSQGTRELSAARARRRLRWEPGCDALQSSDGSPVSVDGSTGTVIVGQRGSWEGQLRLVPQSQPAVEGGFGGADCTERWQLLRVGMRFVGGMSGSAGGAKWQQFGPRSSGGGGGGSAASSSTGQAGSCGLHRDWSSGAPMLVSSAARAAGAAADDVARAERWLGLVPRTNGQLQDLRMEWGEDSLSQGPRTVLQLGKAAVTRVLVSAAASLERAAVAEVQGHPSSPLLDVSQVLSATQAEVAIRSLLAQSRWTSQLAASAAGMAARGGRLGLQFAPRQRQLILTIRPTVVRSPGTADKLEAALTASLEASMVGESVGRLRAAMATLPSSRNSKWLRGLVGEASSIDDGITTPGTATKDEQECRSALAVLAGVGALRGVTAAVDVGLDGGASLSVLTNVTAGASTNVTASVLGSSMSEDVLASGEPLRVGRLLASCRQACGTLGEDRLTRLLVACGASISNDAARAFGSFHVSLGHGSARIGCDVRMDAAGLTGCAAIGSSSGNDRPEVVRVDSTALEKRRRAAAASAISGVLHEVSDIVVSVFTNGEIPESLADRSWSEIAGAASCSALEAIFRTGELPDETRASLLSSSMQQAMHGLADAGTVEAYLDRVLGCVTASRREIDASDMVSGDQFFLVDLLRGAEGRYMDKSTGQEVTGSDEFSSSRSLRIPELQLCPADPTGAVLVQSGAKVDAMKPGVHLHSTRPGEEDMPLVFEATRDFWQGPIGGATSWMRVPGSSLINDDTHSADPSRAEHNVLDAASLAEISPTDEAGVETSTPNGWLRDFIGSKSIPGGSLLLAGEWIRRRRGLGGDAAKLQLVVANCCAVVASVVRSALEAEAVLLALGAGSPRNIGAASGHTAIGQAGSLATVIPLPSIGGLQISSGGASLSKGATPLWTESLFGARLSVSLCGHAASDSTASAGSPLLLRGPPALGSLAVAAAVGSTDQVDALLARAVREVRRVQLMLSEGCDALGWSQQGGGESRSASSSAAMETDNGGRVPEGRQSLAAYLVVPMPFEAIVPARQATSGVNSEGACWAVARTASRMRSLQAALSQCFQESSRLDKGSDVPQGPSLQGIILVPDSPSRGSGDSASGIVASGLDSEGVASVADGRSSLAGSKRTRGSHETGGASPGDSDASKQNAVVAAAASWVRRLRDALAEQQVLWTADEVVIAAVRAVMPAVWALEAPESPTMEFQLGVSATTGLLQRAEACSWAMQAARVQKMLDSAVVEIAEKGRGAAQAGMQRLLPAVPVSSPASSSATGGAEASSSGAAVAGHPVQPPAKASKPVMQGLIQHWLTQGEAIVRSLPPDKQPKPGLDRAQALAGAAGWYLDNDAAATSENLTTGTLPEVLAPCRIKRVLVDASPAAAESRLRAMQAQMDKDVTAAGDGALLTEPLRALAVPPVFPLAPPPSGASQVAWAIPVKLPSGGSGPEAVMAEGCSGEGERSGVVSLDLFPARQLLCQRLGVPCPPMPPGVRAVGVRVVAGWAVRVPVPRVVQSQSGAGASTGQGGGGAVAVATGGGWKRLLSGVVGSSCSLGARVRMQGGGFVHSGNSSIQVLRHGGRALRAGTSAGRNAELGVSDGKTSLPPVEHLMGVGLPGTADVLSRGRGGSAGAEVEGWPEAVAAEAAAVLGEPVSIGGWSAEADAAAGGEQAGLRIGRAVATGSGVTRIGPGPGDETKGEAGRAVLLLRRTAAARDGSEPGLAQSSSGWEATVETGAMEETEFTPCDGSTSTARALARRLASDVKQG